MSYDDTQIGGGASELALLPANGVCHASAQGLWPLSGRTDGA